MNNPINKVSNMIERDLDLGTYRNSLDRNIVGKKTVHMLGSLAKIRL